MNWLMRQEAGKSQDLQGALASWSTRRTDGFIPIHRPAGLRLRKSWHFSLSLKARKKLISQFKGAVRQKGFSLTGGGSTFLFN